MFNSNKLRAMIVEKGLTLGIFSEKTGIKRTALYRKISGKTEFNRREIEIISVILNLSPEQIVDIFFERKVS